MTKINLQKITSYHVWYHVWHNVVCGRNAIFATRTSPPPLGGVVRVAWCGKLGVGENCFRKVRMVTCNFLQVAFKKSCCASANKRDFPFSGFGFMIRSKGTKMLDAAQQKMFNEICDRISEGESMSEICCDLHLPHRLTVLRWLREDEASNGPLRNSYAQAKEAYADLMAEKIRVESETERPTESVSNSAKMGPMVTKSDNVQRSKLIVEALKWTMAKTAPKKWGDRIAVEHSGSVQQIADKDLDAKILALQGAAQ